ncbi:hypothetical protein SEEC0006_06467 [Salmonella enterica subsp. enterica serovar Choleraesuis str. 0006]|nr:hypothetical protein SEEC0006_06467 [Salmonella enterica subsp. enterica serovar Choleraesuis str. 0006]
MARALIFQFLIIITQDMLFQNYFLQVACKHQEKVFIATFHI